MNPLSMLYEKSDDPSEKQRWSMTRLVALLFALTVCWAIVLYAREGHDLNWAFATVGIVTLLAVPLQALCKFLQQWLATSPGQAVLATIAEKIAGKLQGHEHGEEK